MDIGTQCLGIVMRGPATGYQIKKTIQDGPLSQFAGASFAAIYPALARLTAEGLLTVQRTPQPNRPDKKVYAITATGIATFLAALNKPPAQDTFRSPWLYAMTFSDLLSPPAIQRLVADRIGLCELECAKLRSARNSQSSPGSDLAVQWGLHMIEAELTFLRSYAGTAETAGPARALRIAPKSGQGRPVAYAGLTVE